MADAVPVAAAAGLILSGISAALSYAKTDYVLGGRALSPSTGALLAAVGDHLARAGKSIYLAPFTPPANAAARDGLVGELAALSQSALDARERAARHSARIRALTPKTEADEAAEGGAEEESDAAPVRTPPDPDPTHEKPLHEHALTALTLAVALFDTTQTALLTVTEGANGGQRILAARAIETFLNDTDATVAIITLDGAWASSVSKKGLFSSLGGKIPLKVSTFVEASWRCIAASSNRMLGGGTNQFYSPLQDVSSIA